MPVIARYGPKILSIMEAARLQIAAAVADQGLGDIPTELGDRYKDRALLRAGIVVLTPNDTADGFPPNYQRRATLTLTVSCFLRSYIDADGTIELAGLVGAVVDGVAADHTLGGTCDSALPTGVEIDSIEEEGGTLYGADVTITVKFQYTMR